MVWRSNVWLLLSSCSFTFKPLLLPLCCGEDLLVSVDLTLGWMVLGSS